MLKKLLSFALLFVPALSFAQVAPATRGGGKDLWAGAEYSYFKPDYGPNNFSGITVFADLNNVVISRLGVEGEARWLRFNSFQGEIEDNYLAGPRYRVYRFHNASIYAKFLMGAGRITYPGGIGSGSYFAYAPGVTGEYRFKRRWAARADWEYQFWPSAPGTIFTYPYPSNGLNPNGVSVGVSYRIF